MITARPMYMPVCLTGFGRSDFTFVLEVLGSVLPAECLFAATPSGGGFGAATAGPRLGRASYLFGGVLGAWRQFEQRRCDA